MNRNRYFDISHTPKKMEWDGYDIIYHHFKTMSLKPCFKILFTYWGFFYNYE